MKKVARAVFLLVLLAAVSAFAQTYKVIYNLGTNTGDPAKPYYTGAIVQGRDGNFYSSTPFGGTSGAGAVFKVTPADKLTVIHSFTSTEGNKAYAGLTLGTDGNFYGVTYQGGTAGFGTVYKITPAGTVTPLHNFAGGSEGKNPYAPPVQGNDGNFYGTTTTGGTPGFGTVYKVTPTGTFTTIYPFDNTHGNYPTAPLIVGTDGNLYGVTQLGGTNSHGVAFKLTATGKITVLHNFGSDGDVPYPALIQATDNNFYGTTQAGGTNALGTIFKLSPNGTYTKLHDFGTEGSSPYGGLVQATDGNFYGQTNTGGTHLLGSVYKMTPQGAVTVLYNFDGATGSGPYNTPMQHTNGIIYGDVYSGGTLAAGVVYSLNGNFTPYALLVPNSGKVGKQIGILGQGFTGATAVKFNGKAATFNITSNTFMTATVPAGASTGFVTITLAQSTLKSNVKFRVTPFIQSFDPTSGPVGTSVVIKGTTFTGATRVSFGGVAATTFTVDTDSQITAVVPDGAVTGKISVTGPGGTATSAGTFTVE